MWMRRCAIGVPLALQNSMAAVQTPPLWTRLTSTSTAAPSRNESESLDVVPQLQLRVRLLVRTADGSVDGLTSLYIKMIQRLGAERTPAVLRAFCRSIVEQVGANACLSFAERLRNAQWFEHNAYYEALISAFANANDLQTAVKYYTEAGGANVELSPIATEYLISRLARAGQLAEAEKLLKGFQAKGEVTLTARAWQSLIVAQVDAGDPDRAVAMLYKADSNAEQALTRIYNHVVAAMLRNNHGPTAIRLVRHMHRRKIPRDDHTYIMLLRSKNGRSVDLVDDMIRNEDNTIGPRVWKLLLQAQMSRGNHDRSEELRRRIARSKSEQNLASAEELLEGCDVVSARKRLKELVNAQEKNRALIVYFYFLQRLMREGRFNDLMHVWQEDVAPALRPTRAMFEMAIRASVLTGRFDFANEAFFMAMKQLPDWRVRTSLLETLISLLARRGAVQMVWNLLPKSEMGIVRLTLRTYDEIMRCFSKAGKLDDCYRLLEYMQNRELRADTRIYNRVLRAHLLARDADGARQLLQTMELDRATPDRESYGLVLHALKLKGASAEALSLYPKALAAEGQDTRAFATVTQIFAEQGQLQQMRKVYDDLIQQNLKPTAEMIESAMYITKAPTSSLEAKVEALQWVQTLTSRHKLPANLSSYKDLMRFHLSSSGSGSATVLEVFKSMKMDSLVPDLHAYGYVISAARREKKVGLADEVLAEMEQRGLSPNAAMHRHLTALFGGSGQLERALDYYQMFLRQSQSVPPEVVSRAYAMIRRLGDVRFLSDPSSLSSAQAMDDHGVLIAQRIAIAAKKQDLECAMKVFAEAELRVPKLHDVVNAMAYAFASCEHVDDVKKLYFKHHSSAPEEGAGFVKVVLMGLAANALATVDKVEDLWSFFSKQGWNRDFEVQLTHVQALCAAGAFDKAVEAVRELDATLGPFSDPVNVLERLLPFFQAGQLSHDKTKLYQYFDALYPGSASANLAREDAAEVVTNSRKLARALPRREHKTKPRRRAYSVH